MPSVAEFRESLNDEVRALIDSLREIVASAHPDLVERIKWNAPSFAIDGDDRITLGVERKSGARVVLHRGAKPQKSDGFVFDDPEALAKWPSPDRGVIVFGDVADVEARREALVQLCRRWVAQTR